MITNHDAYARLCDKEQWDALRATSIDTSITILEALLTSELMDLAVFADDDQPMSLARSLGIPAERLRRAAKRGTIKDLCRTAGFEPPILCTPFELPKD